MDWAREIINELDGKKAIPANILALIRPSVALLDLGLPPDVLYEHFRWEIRDLLRRMHPDARNGEAHPALRTLSDAFDVVKDKEIFAEALTAARNDRSFERLGERALRGRIQDLQDDIANLKAQFQRQEVAHQEEVARVTVKCQGDLRLLNDIVAKREAFFQKLESKIRFGEWFHKYLVGQMMHFSSWSKSIKPISGYMQLAVISFALSFSFAHTAIPVGELFERVRTSGFAAPSIRWKRSYMRRKLDATTGGVVQEGAFEGWTKVAEQRYHEALEHLTHGLSGLYVDKATIIPQRIIIENQVFNGDAVSKARLYLLGTIDPAVGFTHHQVPSPKERSPRLQVTDEVLPEIEPFVCPGRALVGLSASEPFILTKGFPDTEWTRLMEREETMARSKSTLFLSHIVLDVE